MPPVDPLPRTRALRTVLDNVRDVFLISTGITVGAVFAVIDRYKRWRRKRALIARLSRLSTLDDRRTR